MNRSTRLRSETTLLVYLRMLGKKSSPVLAESYMDMLEHGSMEGRNICVLNESLWLANHSRCARSPLPWMGKD